jgi:hypothetical protein
MSSTALWADFSSEIFSKPYVPTFGEWVATFLDARLAVSEDDYFVSASVVPIKATNGYRIEIHVVWQNTALGRAFITQRWPMKIRSFQLTCQTWALEGYTIDFDRDVTVTVEQVS